MRVETVTCDNCKKDITATVRTPRCRLRLSNEWLPRKAGVCLDVIVSEHIDEDMHFCGMMCLVTWTAVWHSEREAAKAAFEARQRERSAH
jgi:hypothetical protein